MYSTPLVEGTVAIVIAIGQGGQSPQAGSAKFLMQLLFTSELVRSHRQASDARGHTTSDPYEYERLETDSL